MWFKYGLLPFQGVWAKLEFFKTYTGKILRIWGISSKKILRIWGISSKKILRIWGISSKKILRIWGILGKKILRKRIFYVYLHPNRNINK